jgi:4-hydroxy-3-methylbut-2-enyl diphosphate reductase
VVRAIDTVEAALQRLGPPIYVHHEIVHNPHVVAGFRQRGVIFVDSADDVPPGGRAIISAHGAPPSVFTSARSLKLRVVDATCPLVTKVHREVAHHVQRGRRVILVGHKEHAEIIGTAGYGQGATAVVESVADAETLPIDPLLHYAYATQTTLAVDETAEIVAILRRRIPGLIGPPSCDICYATTNRQAAIRAIVARCEGIVVVGGANSSNSQRLVDVARAAGCTRLWFVSRGAEAEIEAFDGLGTLGISSGASTPAELVDELLDRLEDRFILTVETVTAAIEGEHYNLPSLRPFYEQPA